MLKTDLEKIGLNDKETKFYLGLLELGEGSIAKISLKTGLKRTTCYDIVASLKEKGLISQITKKGKTRYFAEEPANLERLLDEKRHILKSIMPQLLSITNLIDKKPKVRYFEGMEGIKDAYRDTLKYPDQEMQAWPSAEVVRNFDADWLRNYYLPKRVENKIWMRAILPDTKELREFTKLNQEHLRQVRYISSDQTPFEVEINLYGGRLIAIMSFQEKFSMIIESKKIYNTLKSIFELCWSNLPEVEKI
jgi:sugar-specific transcriptional regulator TrmB